MSGGVTLVQGVVAADPSIAAITGGTGVAIRVLGGAIPFVHAPTGSMGNNGAVTLGTALPRIITSCWMLLPAGSIATSTPAADTWYYVQMSSTTVGTVFNNIYTSGATTPPASPTAFATTGPGAYTGSTATVSGPNVSLSAGAMGVLGTIKSEIAGTHNNSAGSKTYKITLGSTDFWNNTPSTSTSIAGYVDITNQGDAAHQFGDVSSGNISPTAVGVGSILGTENTANALTLAHKVGKAVATDFAIIERYADWLTAMTSGGA